MANSRRVVITGGASGIGAATVARFAESGDEVVVVDRVRGDAGHRWIECDLTSGEAIARAAADIGDGVDVLCNIAGVAGTAPVKTIVGVNFLGLRALTDLLVPGMTPGGSVVNLASTAGWNWRIALPAVSELIATPDYRSGLDWAQKNLASGYDAYERSKQAVIVWTNVASQRHLGHVRVNSVSPGPIETPLLAEFYESMGHAELDPLTERAGGRNGTPVEIANVVAFLTSQDASWINGTDIVTDGGAEMAVSLAERGVLRTPDGAAMGDPR
ncbi:SDR family oxidoreductase [Saccharopolyspora terrae]|uniref:SDR family oxidoreductase n=1 Tax=Saccharopolyspora terrae TaxID=2530384 RepID=A0A4R4VSW7_9PSEU|nr:coniferyl-alcohol dehydrogenase [Saccharopolyspora terrae]TDD03330.1 SDR family oxidoreductase [Saccharopolyspora terrae]